MIYGGDAMLAMPIMDLYDKDIMRMSIAAAKDMYDRAEQRMKDFNKEYGDFISPIQKDMDWYNQNVTGKVQNAINDLYASGIDPLRNPEGRAAIQRLIYSMPTGKIANLRQSADTAREYMKNRGVLEAKNLYDPDYENWVLTQKGLPSFDQWSTLENGEWTRTAPAEFQTLNQATSHWFDDMKGSDKGTKNGYRMFGIDDQDLLDTANPHLQGFTNSQLGQYYLNQRANQIRRDNPDISEAEVQSSAREQLLKDVAAANKERKFMKADTDQFALENLRHRHEMAQISARNRSGSGNGRGGQEGVPVIFREAAARPGAEVNYDVDESPHYQWIDPLVQGARTVKGSKGNYAYNIPASSMSSIYKKNVRNADGTRVSAQWDYGFAMSDATFIPTGQMRMETDFTGQPHYYITGTLANNSTGREVVGRNGTELYEMEVTERAYNYGKKQATTYQPDN